MDAEKIMRDALLEILDATGDGDAAKWDSQKMASIIGRVRGVALRAFDEMDEQVYQSGKQIKTR